MNHEQRRAKGRTTNTEPTLTDQSGADATNINVILKQYSVSGRAPGAPVHPMHGDFTNLPTDLRGFIETSRQADELRQRLPPQLRDKTADELNALTGEQLGKLLAPAPTPDKTESETK